MEINVFEGVNKNELSMIEVAHAILEQRGDVMDFSDLVNQIQNYLETSDSEIRDSLAQFYFFGRQSLGIAFMVCDRLNR